MLSTVSRRPSLLLFRRFLPFPWPSPHRPFSSSSAAATAAALTPCDRESSGSQGSAPTSIFDRENLVCELDSTPYRCSAAGVFRRFPSPKGFSFQAMPRSNTPVALRPDLAGRMRSTEDYLNNPDAVGALASLVASSCREGRDALKVFKAACLEGRCPSISVCNALLGALVDEGGDLQSVVFVYKEMVKGGVTADVQTLNYLIEALFQASRVDSAMVQFRRMKAKGCVPNSQTFELVMRNLCVNGRVDESVKVLDEMFECGSMKLFQLMKVMGVHPDSSVYGALICCLCENGDLNSAVHLLKEMLEKGLAPEANVHVSVVNGFCKLGKLDEATIFLDESNALKVEPYNALVQGYCGEALCESQNVGKAFEVLGRIVVSGYRPDEMLVGGCLPDEKTYYLLIHGFCTANMTRDAVLLFDQMIYLGFIPSAELVDALLSHLAKHSQRSKKRDAAAYVDWEQLQRCLLETPCPMFELGASS
ncbi:hypothetical protein Taro_012754 [Colocasia esculenta]|uniref:Pentatricopeptide repeat-containing protein n=1 Tax=Colocasia esculenta TaxID=4460 RepID=A0A843UA39_COLES|nr:hypothetical protein [Colocasia esculenta]